MIEHQTAPDQPGKDRDISAELVSAVREASTTAPLYINAGGSKRALYGRHCDGAALNIGAHRGIIDYNPRELVLTARAATPLIDIVGALAQENQALAFEPPVFSNAATLGGTLACNLSGPARPFAGSMRDAVLGVQLINGLGEQLNFGGQVMKNVAGYDISRLQAGAMGTLGIITQISLKVLPRPQQEITLCYQMSAPEALATMQQRAAQPQPLSGAFWQDGMLYLRLAGASSAVAHTAHQWGGEPLENAAATWRALGALTLPFFAGDGALWRLSQQATAPLCASAGDTLIDWCGAQRWVRGEQDRNMLDETAAAAGGHVTLVRGGDRSGEVRSAPDAVSRTLHQRLKAAFDPHNIFNPGRLYGWL